MRAPIDLTGHLIGRLTVLHREDTARGPKLSAWRVRCDCGREEVYPVARLDGRGPRVTACVACTTQRRCVICDGPIPVERGRRRTCSAECADRKRLADKRIAAARNRERWQQIKRDPQRLSAVRATGRAWHAEHAATRNARLRDQRAQLPPEAAAKQADAYRTYALVWRLLRRRQKSGRAMVSAESVIALAAMRDHFLPDQDALVPVNLLLSPAETAQLIAISDGRNIPIGSLIRAALHASGLFDDRPKSKPPAP
jgi:hypothetical protein